MSAIPSLLKSEAAGKAMGWKVAGLIAVSLMGRVAAWSYGAVTTINPGFGLPSYDAGHAAGHIAASSAAFGLVAGLCAIFAAASALVSWAGLKR